MTFTFSITSVVFGDFTGDGVDDALIIQSWDGWGTGKFSRVEMYTMNGDTPKRLLALPSGDRADGGVVDVAVSGGFAVVKRHQLASGDEFRGLCCPTHVRTEFWKWNGSSMVEDVARRKVERLDRTGLPPASPASPTMDQQQAVAEAWRLAGQTPAYGGECSKKPPGACGIGSDRLGGYTTWLVAVLAKNHYVPLGTVLIRASGSDWEPFAFDPTTSISRTNPAVGASMVNGGGQCVNVRTSAARSAALVKCVPDRSSVSVTGAAAFADGFIWLPVDQGGWIAGRYLCPPGSTTICPTKVPGTTWVFR
jgi:hypothetical protein